MMMMMMMMMMKIFNKEKLHVSANSGHHQVFTPETLKIVLYNSLDGVLMKRSRHQTPAGT